MRCLLASLLALSVSAHAGEHRIAPTDFVLPSGEHVPGALLGDVPGMTAQAARARAAVLAAFGVDIARVPVHVVTIEEIRALHDQVGGRLRSGWQLHGFELDSHVFVRRGLGGVSDEVLIHECLHAMSRTFSNAAHAQGISRLVEGITQHLTLQALALRPHASQLKAERNRTYVGAEAFADALATLVGDTVLHDAYFGDGLVAMMKRVDTLRHGRRILQRAAAILDNGSEVSAIELLTGAR